MMKVGVYEGKEQISVEEVAVPTLEDGEVLIKVDACAVCGTDLRTYRHGDKKIEPPRILGHEFCGSIVESRAGDSKVSIGDRVAMYIVLPCGECRYCRMKVCINPT